MINTMNRKRLLIVLCAMCLAAVSALTVTTVFVSAANVDGIPLKNYTYWNSYVDNNPNATYTEVYSQYIEGPENLRTKYPNEYLVWMESINGVFTGYNLSVRLVIEKRNDTYDALLHQYATVYAEPDDILEKSFTKTLSFTHSVSQSITNCESYTNSLTTQNGLKSTATLFGAGIEANLSDTASKSYSESTQFQTSVTDTKTITISSQYKHTKKITEAGIYGFQLRGWIREYRYKFILSQRITEIRNGEAIFAGINQFTSPYYSLFVIEDLPNVSYDDPFDIILKVAN